MRYAVFGGASGRTNLVGIVMVVMAAMISFLAADRDQGWNSLGRGAA
jgi:hypothetical protein